MPYKTTSELPDSIKHVLPDHAQDIFMAAYNNAFKEYKDPSDRRGDASLEETAHKIAWAAVKREYKKDEDGKWHQRKN